MSHMPGTESPGAGTTAGLVSNALRHLSNLVRGEIELAKAEAREKLARAARGLVLIAVAVLLALVTLGLAATLAVLGLVAAGLSPLAATAICAAVGVVATLIAAFIGLRSLNPSGLAPDRAVRSLRRDALTLKRSFSHDQAH